MDREKMSEQFSAVYINILTVTVDLIFFLQIPETPLPSVLAEAHISGIRLTIA